MRNASSRNFVGLARSMGGQFGTVRPVMSRQGRVVPIYVGTLGPKFIEYLRQCGWQEDAPFSLFLERELHHGGKGP